MSMPKVISAFILARSCKLLMFSCCMMEVIQEIPAFCFGGFGFVFFTLKKNKNKNKKRAH